jgi:hypothetical protein
MLKRKVSCTFKREKISLDNQERIYPSEQSSIDNHQSAIVEGTGAQDEPREQSSIDNRQSPILDGLHLRWRVERLIGVFLCSEAYHAFKAAEQWNRRVEEAFRALQAAVNDALGRLGIGSQPSAVAST